MVDLKFKIQKGEDPIDAAYRIDMKMLRKLISTCDKADIARHCRSRVDGIFIARDLCNGYAMSSLDNFREVTGILPFMDGKCKPRPSATVYPAKGSKKYKKNIDRLQFDAKFLKDMYPDQPKCAVWLFPYIQFKVSLCKCRNQSFFMLSKSLLFFGIFKPFLLRKKSFCSFTRLTYR